MKKLLLLTTLIFSLTSHAFIDYESRVDFSIENNTAVFWLGEITTPLVTASKLTNSNYKTSIFIVEPFTKFSSYIWMPRNLLSYTKDVMEIDLTNSINSYDTLNWASYKELKHPGIRNLTSVSCQVYPGDFDDLSCTPQ